MRKLAVSAVAIAAACGADAVDVAPYAADAGVDAAVVDATTALDASPLDATPGDAAPFVAAFDDKRECLSGGELWEVCFDGKELPGHGLMPHLAWDNPIDDTWTDHSYRVSGVRINRSDQGVSFLHANTAADTGKAWFLFRDPELRRAQGIDIQVRLRILAGSNPISVHLFHFDEGEEFSLHFDPDRVVFNSVITGSPVATGRVEAALDLTTWREFLVRKLPGSPTVVVRQRSAAQTQYDNPFSVALAATDGANSKDRRPYSQTLFGATERGATTGGIFDVAHINMRRVDRDGGWPAQVAAPEPAPSPSQTFDHAIGVSPATCSATHFDTFTALGSPGAVHLGAPCQADTRPVADGGTAPADLSRCMSGAGGAPSLSTDGFLRGGTAVANDARIELETGSTTEMRFRFASDLGDGAIVVAGSEGPGAFELRLTKTAVTATSFSKPETYLAGTNAPYVEGWNTLRVVRPASSIYAYVYLNGVLVLRHLKLAVRADYRRDDPFGDRPGVAFIKVGATPLPTSPSEAWSRQDDIPNQGWGGASAIEVDCVRWAWSAHAP